MLKRTLFLGILLYSTTIFAKGPEITGPEKIKIGGKCVLRVADLEEGKRGWVPMNLSDGAEIVTFDKGTTLVFFTGSKPGTYMFMFGFCEKEEEEIEYLVHELVVEGSVVVPPVTPPKPIPPKPVPPTPGEKYGLITLSKALAVANGNGPPESKSLAAAYRAVAVQAHTDIQSMITAQKNMNKTLLGEGITKWVPWFTQLAKSLGELQQSGKLITLAQHKEAWLEIASGLEAVK